MGCLRRATAGALASLLLAGCSFSPVQVGLGAPIQAAPRSYAIYGVSVSLFSARNRSTIGASAAGFFNLADDASGGIQIAGLGNAAYGDYYGIQAALIGNRAGGFGRSGFLESQCLTGFQLAAIANFGNVRGLSLALSNGLDYPSLKDVAEDLEKEERSQSYQSDDQKKVTAVINTARLVLALSTDALVDGKQTSVQGFVEGAQVGLANYASRVNGAQLGGFCLTEGDVAGFQLSGLFNQAYEVAGAQLGLANMALGDAAGLQLGALYNRAETMDGLQIGLVNQAGDAWFQLGLLNFNESGAVPWLPLINWRSSGPGDEPEEESNEWLDAYDRMHDGEMVDG